MNTVYPVTPTLSVAGSHTRSALVGVTPVTWKFGGAVGGSVSWSVGVTGPRPAPAEFPAASTALTLTVYSAPVVSPVTLNVVFVVRPTSTNGSPFALTDTTY